jgi:ribosomal protein L11 methyltransferase
MRQVCNIAPRVVVYPFGTSPPAVEEGWIALALGPGSLVVPGGQGHAVFGDGSHATTRLCAAAVDLLCRQRPGLAVLDVGTGTGVLARIARARGASFVVGTDIDPAAVACARANARMDEPPTASGTGTTRGSDAGTIQGSDAGTIQGSDTGLARLDTVPRTVAIRADIHFGGEPPDHWGGRFDLVVANILESPLHDLAPALRGALAPGGILFISGFTRPQMPSLRVHYEQEGLTFQGDFKLDEWALLKFILSGPR